MCGDPLEYISYEFISASPAMSCMSGSPNLNSFRDRGQVAVQLLSCGVLLPGLVQDCTQHSCGNCHLVSSPAVLLASM